MTAPNHFNFNDIIPTFDRRTCEIGDQTFDITDVPMGVGVVFLRAQIDPLYSSADATIDATLIMLNQKREQKDWIDRAWLDNHVPGNVVITVTNRVLHPFWNPPTKEGEKKEEETTKGQTSLPKKA